MRERKRRKNNKNGVGRERKREREEEQEEEEEEEEDEENAVVKHRCCCEAESMVDNPPNHKGENFHEENFGQLIKLFSMLAGLTSCQVTCTLVSCHFFIR